MLSFSMLNPSRCLISSYESCTPQITDSSLSNGQLCLHVRSGRTQSDFKQELMGVLGGVVDDAPATPSPRPAFAQGIDSPNASNLTASRLPPSTPRAASTVQDLFEDRRRRLEVDKTAKESAEKAERIAKAQARREAIDIAPESAKAKQAGFAQQQRKRQQEAKLERERILKEIENDKIARREREERRKALAISEGEGNDGAEGLVDRQLWSEMTAPGSISSEDCAMQVRLFDGSTIRSRFPSNQTLRTHVRDWVDGQRSDGDSPYTFRQILAPMPNRAITISEEDESLQSLDLTPSATLVMVPVQGYIPAYAAGPGLVSRGILTSYNALSAGARTVTGALGTFLGVGQPAATTLEQGTQGNSGAVARDSGQGVNIRTLRDQREGQDDQQFYNGNHVSKLVDNDLLRVLTGKLNFEPRRDHDDKED